MIGEKLSWGLISKYKKVIYGIAAFSIVIYHYCSIFSYYPDFVRPKWANLYFNIISSIGVELFLFISGISLYFSYSKNQDIMGFYKKRLQRIIIPYGFIGLVFWFLSDIIMLKKGLEPFFKDFFFVTFWLEGEGRFWYAIIILIFYLGYPIIYRYFYQKEKGLLVRFLVIELAVVLFILYIFIFHREIFRNIQIGLTRIPVFLLGCFYGKKVFDDDRITKAEGTIMVFGFLLRFLTLPLKLNMISIRLVSVLFAFFCCVLLALLLNTLEYKFSYKSKIFTWLGSISFETYLMNVAVIKLFVDTKICIVDGKYLLVIAMSVLGGYLTVKINIIFTKFFCLMKKSKIPTGLIVLVVTFLFRIMLNLALNTITVPSDEFNTVSAAAQLAGLNWNNVNTPPGYYGYIAVILVVPLFKWKFLLENPYWLYQAILCINALCSAMYAFFLYKIIVVLSKGLFSRWKCALITFVSISILQFVSIGQITNNDISYAVMHIIAFYLLIVAGCSDSKIRKALCGAGCAAASVFALGGNNRGAVLVIAISLCIIIIGLIRKKWIVSPITYYATLITFLIVHKFLLYPYFRTFFPKDSYNTDMNLIFDRIPRILSNWSDMKACLVAFMGWLYTFIVSTYGIGAIIIGIVVYVCWHLLKKSGEFTGTEEMIAVMLLLWIIGTSALCIINFLDSFQGILQYNTTIQTNPTRVDKLFYFRYYIACVPFGIAFSLLLAEKYKMVKNKKFIILLSASTYFIIIFFHKYLAVMIKKMSYATSSTSFIGLFLGKWTKNYKYGDVFPQKFFYCTCIAVLCLVIMYYCYKNMKSKQWLIMLLATEIVICFLYTFAYSVPRANVWNNLKNEEIVAIMRSDGIEDIYIENSELAFLYQFSVPIKIVYSEFNQQDVLLIDDTSKLDEAVYDDYTCIIDNKKRSLWINNSKKHIAVRAESKNNVSQD